MSAQPIKVVCGGNRVGNREPFTTDTHLEEALQILATHNVNTIDSAQAYGNSQATIGDVKIGDRFIIDTKWGPPRRPGAGPPQPGVPPAAWATKEHIVNSAKDSIAKLGVQQVDIFYIHMPDSQTPIAETLAGVDEVYKLGLFRRFGLSNYQATDVEAVYNHCAEQGYVLPTVYQGTYSPITRYQETALFPTLRRLGIAFYAFSPSAGGFLGKTVAQIEESLKNPPAGPFRRRYAENPVFVSALAKWNAVADEEGIRPAELAYRAVAYHSALKRELGDALIIGASSIEQLEETLASIENGPLSEKAQKGVDEVWDLVKNEPPIRGFPPRPPQPSKEKE
ncbi:Aldo/keto reductase [Niveomyces insectorum RCEF 264]|uniref:Aldo/keto reductase n=1 Tax=Niveomyces insectorum RCEF 264 TaxID=1081102 RepID=A0A167T8R6_9HYPO|nr:Aldo/keto reductase [Niveomyces insectorum RCEF 264]